MKQLLTYCLVGLGLIVGIGFGSPKLAWAQGDEGPAASVRISVLYDSNGKPVKNARVVLHSVNRKGKAKDEIDLKTDAEGHASIDGIPYGTVEVQVVTQGFQTFGQDFPVSRPSLEVTVRLKRPTGQYSIYENHDDKQPPDEKPQ